MSFDWDRKSTIQSQNLYVNSIHWYGICMVGIVPIGIFET